MRYWWVNQNQTFEQEFGGGYIWSPKRRADGARNQFYENMREVAPGDIIFSFRHQEIAAIGVAQSHGYDCPKPTEFGSIGENWEKQGPGWRVDVSYVAPGNKIKPRDHIGILAPLLPKQYSPLRMNGDGLQGVYLAEISQAFAETLGGLIGVEAQQLISAAGENVMTGAPRLAARGIDEWEERIQESVVANRTLQETEKTAIIRARRGQGIFKENVMRREGSCRITKVDNPAHLIGSHIKPWRDSNNDERLDGANGLLLTPSIDHLFDRGFISFENNGDLLVSPVADVTSLQRMGVTPGTNVGDFHREQRTFLEFHREAVFLQASRPRA